MLARLLGLAILLATATAGARTPDWTPYADLLSDHVTERTVEGITLNWVDYTALREDPRYRSSIERLAAFEPEQLDSRAERLAFYINAYNLLAIKVVLDNWPLESIRDAGSLFTPVWKIDAGTIGGETVTLHEVEHEILRELGEPRIHFAINCASLSCPDLRTEPYRAEDLDAQLEAATRAFLDNRGKGLRVTSDEVEVSQIFDWFESDFEPAGGVRAFIERYRPGLPEDKPVAADIDYDWSLNGS